MKRISTLTAVFAFALCAVYSLASPAPSMAGDADLWRGLQFTDCDYTPMTKDTLPGYRFLITHDSGREVLVETGGVLKPALVPLFLDASKDPGSAACSGFKLVQCEYIPPNKSYPMEFNCQVEHSSGARVLIKIGEVYQPGELGLFLKDK